MMKHLVILLLLSICTGNSFCQVAKDDFAAINKTYSTNKRLSMKMKYEVYKNKQTKTPFEIESGEVQRDGAETRTVISNIETIRNDKYTLIVDHEDKNISLLDNDEGRITKEDEQIYMVNLESLLKLCAKLEFKSENNRQNSYLLSLPNSEYSEVKIVYNKKTFFIEKMLLYYAQAQNLEGNEAGIKETPRLEITYSDLNIKPVFSDKVFTYDKFIEKHNGKLRCKEMFKTYHISEDLSN